MRRDICFLLEDWGSLRLASCGPGGSGSAVPHPGLSPRGCKVLANRVKSNESETITGWMSYADALTRISQIQSLLGQVSAQGAEPPASLQPSSTSFSTLLQRASTANAPTAAGGTGADSPGTAALE